MQPPTCPTSPLHPAFFYGNQPDFMLPSYKIFYKVTANRVPPTKFPTLCETEMVE